ncbi:hypothetical protein AAFF_G00230790 [Aldrovandia affinis]|uniref:Phospholipid/glycerol acyltransferase domain-containing protein n=1 Tax=Aldrovandia affinis TaxID=143900 RepID=A0AAD7RFD5_9TELE|nr:hypothetical protein AAFF_G00230790 [Aldrovandia affinis]
MEEWPSLPLGPGFQSPGPLDLRGLALEPWRYIPQGPSPAPQTCSFTARQDSSLIGRALSSSSSLFGIRSVCASPLWLTDHNPPLSGEDRFGGAPPLLLFFVLLGGPSGIRCGLQGQKRRDKSTMLHQGCVMIFTGVCGALIIMALAYYVYWFVKENTVVGQCERGAAPIMGLMTYLKTQFLLQLLISFVFVVSGLLINFLQLCSCLLWPINKQLYRRINCRLAYSLWSQLVMLFEWWSGTECTLYTEQATVDKFGKEHVIIILNHNYEIDFLCGWTMCERYGVLGSSKVLAKHELLKVPLIGWTWYFLEIVFCKRKWEVDRDTVYRGLERLKDYPECMWFLLYCEGTRFTEKKHQISMQVAESKGLPKLKYHLLPRTKGFTTTLHCLKGTVTAVYDVTLNFKDKKNPTLLGIISGEKYMADMHSKNLSLRRPLVFDVQVTPQLLQEQERPF